MHSPATHQPVTHRPPGLIDGVGVDMYALRPAVIKAQAAMRAGYEQAAPCTYAHAHARSMRVCGARV